MKQRGRKSAASLETPRASRRSGKARVEPRSTAPAPVAALIREIVFAVDADHFRVSDWPLLESYAKAILLEQKAYAELEMAGPVTPKGKLSPWLAVIEKSGRQIVAVSARLRLSPQHRAQSKTIGKGVRAPSIYATMEQEDPVIIDAFRRNDHAALARALQLRPWEVNPIDAGPGPCPWPAGSAGARSWCSAQALRRELEAASK